MSSSLKSCIWVAKKHGDKEKPVGADGSWTPRGGRGATSPHQGHPDANSGGQGASSPRAGRCCVLCRRRGGLDARGTSVRGQEHSSTGTSVVRGPTGHFCPCPSRPKLPGSMDRVSCADTGCWERRFIRDWRRPWARTDGLVAAPAAQLLWGPPPRIIASGPHASVDLVSPGQGDRLGLRNQPQAGSRGGSRGLAARVRMLLGRHHQTPRATPTDAVR